MAKDSETDEEMEAKSKGAAEKGRQKHRSPNYPLFDLEKALQLTKVLYDSDKTHRIPILIAHERWGYTKGGTAGNQAVAAVKSYGLINVDGNGDSRQISVSDVGRRIILDAPDKAELLKSSALSPALFASLWDRYREQGMPSKDVLRHHLIFDRNFNETFVGNAIDRFVSTIAFSQLDVEDNISHVPGSEEDEEETEDKYGHEKPGSEPVKPKRRRQMEVGTIEDVVNIPEGTVAIQWPSHLSSDSAKFIKSWVELMLMKMDMSSRIGVKPEADE